MGQTIPIWNSYDKTNKLKLFSEKLTHVSICDKCINDVQISRSMAAAIFEMPQYVAYQKNVPYGLFTLSTKSHTFNRY